MTSELRVDNLKGSTTGGSINVLGEGTSVTTNLQQGLVKCWSKSEQSSTASGEDSFNQASITDHGAGDYGINMTNPFSNTGYAAVTDTSSDSGHVSAHYGADEGSGNRYTAGIFRMFVFEATSGSGATDSTHVCAMLAGDLA
jgi:hypothetical protein